MPVQWILDDAPLFRHVYGATNAIADPARVFDLWSREFAGMYREHGCFVLTCHPFVIGRASRIMLLEELVGYMRRFPGVWFDDVRGGGALAREAGATRGVNRPPGGDGFAPHRRRGLALSEDEAAASL